MPARYPQPIPPGHPAEVGMRRPRACEVLCRETLQEKAERGAVLVPPSWAGRAGFSRRAHPPLGPWHDIDAKLLEGCKPQRRRNGARGNLAKGHAELIGQVADHFGDGLTAPTSLCIRSQSVNACQERVPDFRNWQRTHKPRRPNESRLSCGRSARRRKMVERQTKRVASEGTQFFPTCERPPA